MPRIAFDQLAGLPTLRRFYGLIWNLFRVNAALDDPKVPGGFRMKSTRKVAPFCAELQKRARFQRRCQACDRQHMDRVREQQRPLRYHCHAGLTEFLIPIVLDGEVIALLQSGQVLDAPPTRQRWQRMRAALKLTAGEAATLEPLYFNIRAIPPDAQKNLVALLEFFGNHIAHTQSRMMLLEQPWNSQIVARAQSHIRDNVDRRISLDDVARAAFTSKRNLTRVFLQEAGMTVLEYIHDRRLARVCRELDEGRKTCTQIANACGFGSIQQFNRVFRKRKGMPPKAWRNRKGSGRG
ncbi:MAG: helix-turn-helix domain-containing protein [Planctomycetota bacterium]